MSWSKVKGVTTSTGSRDSWILTSGVTIQMGAPVGFSLGGLPGKMFESFELFPLNPQPPPYKIIFIAQDFKGMYYSRYGYR